MSNKARLPFLLYRSPGLNEPVKDCLKSLSKEDRKIIGEDTKTVQFGWPIGMPVVRKLDNDPWEIRSRIESRIARVIFTVESNEIVLLHGFIKKSQKLAKKELNIAKSRLVLLKGEINER